MAVINTEQDDSNKVFFFVKQFWVAFSPVDDQLFLEQRYHLYLKSHE